MEYRSWISTLSGHLFFHLSEPWNYRLDRIVGDVVHFNEKIGDERYIGISLLADLRDYNTKKKIKYTRIFFFGKTHLNSGDDGKSLNGNISFFSNGKNILFEKDEQELVQNLELLRVKLKNLKKNQIDKNARELQNEFEYIKRKVLDYNKEENSVYTRKIQFSLQSEGIIELGNAKDANFTYIATKTEFRQAYYFIKFMFHNHMHHVKSAEDIIRLTKINDTTTDKQFAFFMISDIKKYMVELRHSRKGFQDLEGFTAYAKSLVRILEKKDFIDSKIREREEKYFDNFVQSINKYINNIKFNTVNTTFNNLFDAFLKIFVILMSIIAPYAIMKSKGITEVKKIEDFLYNDIVPLYLLGFFILLIIIPASDFIYNSKNSFIHKKWNLFKEKLCIFIKKHHNPTLNNKSLSEIIDFRQFLYHLSFEDKRWSFYLQMAIPFILLLLYIINKFK